ncbi:FAD-dependent oxidoreductase [Pseudomonas jinjuensis]|uniref:FAD binding domain-containing protein n=1 Tax=Pseudomonas jinjuensis TaxID=198616 RepID=A0A1H0EJK3_9PSED|nr:FAD-dependent oxidoreductase [Pseudomonas jinjuensis]SDN82531.1 FAD binding domain-containing protein [Pseudomonas jinjuensis]
MDKENKNLSRRKVLIGAGIAAGAATTLGLGGSLVAAEKGSSEQKWDMETDVVVVGTGAAGGSAAVTATALGAKVIVVEKMPMAGGTTGKSGGVTWIPNNKYMVAQGIDDKRDDCLRYIARYAYPEAYDASSATLGLPEPVHAMMAAFYDNGPKMIEWMEQIEAVRFRPFKMWDVNMSPPDYGDHLPENKANNARALEPSVGAGSSEGGSSLALQLEQWLTKRKVPVLLNHRAVGVIRDGERVIGLEVESEGRRLRIRANKGVIFGSGGFAHNTDLVRLHQPGIYGACAMPGSTGDFIAIAQDAGARMGTLSTAWRTQVVLEQALENRALPAGVFFVPGDSMIQVNKYGVRVVNEKRNYNDRTRCHFTFDPVNAEYPNRLMVMVFDERSLNRYAGALPLPLDKRESKWLIEGADVQQLTQRIKERLASLGGKVGNYALDDSFARNLDATIERFNGFAEKGEDEDFQRGFYEYDRVWNKLFSPVSKNATFPDNDKPNKTMYPIDRKSTLYAVLLAPGALDTNAGPAINPHGQVLAAHGEPIPGLYGAGNCIASPSGPAYLGAGGTIGLALTFGYLAARHATGNA